MNMQNFRAADRMKTERILGIFAKPLPFLCRMWYNRVYIQLCNTVILCDTFIKGDLYGMVA